MLVTALLPVRYRSAEIEGNASILWTPGEDLTGPSSPVSKTPQPLPWSPRRSSPPHGRLLATITAIATIFAVGFLIVRCMRKIRGGGSSLHGPEHRFLAVGGDDPCSGEDDGKDERGASGLSGSDQLQLLMLSPQEESQLTENERNMVSSARKRMLGILQRIRQLKKLIKEDRKEEETLVRYIRDLKTASGFGINVELLGAQHLLHEKQGITDAAQQQLQEHMRLLSSMAPTRGQEVQRLLLLALAWQTGEPINHGAAAALVASAAVNNPDAVFADFLQEHEQGMVDNFIESKIAMGLALCAAVEDPNGPSKENLSKGVNFAREAWNISRLLRRLQKTEDASRLMAVTQQLSRVLNMVSLLTSFKRMSWQGPAISRSLRSGIPLTLPRRRLPLTAHLQPVPEVPHTSSAPQQRPPSEHSGDPLSLSASADYQYQLPRLQQPIAHPHHPPPPHPQQPPPPHLNHPPPQHPRHPPPSHPRHLPPSRPHHPPSSYLPRPPPSTPHRPPFSYLARPPPSHFHHLPSSSHRPHSFRPRSAPQVPYPPFPFTRLNDDLFRIHFPEPRHPSHSPARHSQSLPRRVTSAVQLPEIPRAPVGPVRDPLREPARRIDVRSPDFHRHTLPRKSSSLHDGRGVTPHGRLSERPPNPHEPSGLPPLTSPAPPGVSDASFRSPLPPIPDDHEPLDAVPPVDVAPPPHGESQQPPPSDDPSQHDKPPSSVERPPSDDIRQSDQSVSPPVGESTPEETPPQETPQPSPPDQRLPGHAPRKISSRDYKLNEECFENQVRLQHCRSSLNEALRQMAPAALPRLGSWLTGCMAEARGALSAARATLRQGNQVTTAFPPHPSVRQSMTALEQSARDVELLLENAVSMLTRRWVEAVRATTDVGGQQDSRSPFVLDPPSARPVCDLAREVLSMLEQIAGEPEELEELKGLIRHSRVERGLGRLGRWRRSLTRSSKKDKSSKGD